MVTQLRLSRYLLSSRSVVHADVIDICRSKCLLLKPTRQSICMCTPLQYRRSFSISLMNLHATLQVALFQYHITTSLSTKNVHWRSYMDCSALIPVHSADEASLVNNKGLAMNRNRLITAFLEIGGLTTIKHSITRTHSQGLSASYFSINRQTSDSRVGSASSAYCATGLVLCSLLLGCRPIAGMDL